MREEVAWGIVDVDCVGVLGIDGKNGQACCSCDKGKCGKDMVLKIGKV